MSNELLLVARRKAEILDDLINCTVDFELDEPVNGADFVEFFAEWRGDTIAELGRLVATYG